MIGYDAWLQREPDEDRPGPRNCACCGEEIAEPRVEWDADEDGTYAIVQEYCELCEVQGCDCRVSCWCCRCLRRGVEVEDEVCVACSAFGEAAAAWFRSTARTERAAAG